MGITPTLGSRLGKGAEGTLGAQRTRHEVTLMALPQLPAGKDSVRAWPGLTGAAFVTAEAESLQGATGAGAGAHPWGETGNVRGSTGTQGSPFLLFPPTDPGPVPGGLRSPAGAGGRAGSARGCGSGTSENRMLAKSCGIETEKEECGQHWEPQSPQRRGLAAALSLQHPPVRLPAPSGSSCCRGGGLGARRTLQTHRGEREGCSQVGQDPAPGSRSPSEVSSPPWGCSCSPTSPQPVTRGLPDEVGVPLQL